MKKSVLVLIILSVMVLGVSIFFLIGNVEVEKVEEYVPIQEITEEEERQTCIFLYFVNKATGELVVEERLIDAKGLAQNPYEVILELLKNGPKSNELVKVIPEGIEIKSVIFDKNTVKVNLKSEEIEKEEILSNQMLKNAIDMSLKQLNEVKNVEIILN